MLVNQAFPQGFGDRGGGAKSKLGSLGGEGQPEGGGHGFIPLILGGTNY